MLRFRVVFIFNQIYTLLNQNICTVLTFCFCSLLLVHEIVLYLSLTPFLHLSTFPRMVSSFRYDNCNVIVCLSRPLGAFDGVVCTISAECPCGILPDKYIISRLNRLPFVLRFSGPYPYILCTEEIVRRGATFVVTQQKYQRAELLDLFCILSKRDLVLLLPL